MLVAALVRIAVEKMREGSGVTLRVGPKHADNWRRYFAEFATMSHVVVEEDASLSERDCYWERNLDQPTLVLTHS